MANAKDFVGQGAEPVSQGDVVALKNLLAQSISGVAVRETNRGKGTGVFRRILTLNLQSPLRDRATGRFGGPLMPREYALKSLGV